VKFTQAVEALRASGVGTFVEVGAGNVLSGLVKRIDRGLNSISVSAPEHIAKARELVAGA
jgi:[acyl-carrier-protein] S-malonyltransferase